MNEHFPHWITANVILEEIVDRFWRVGVQQTDRDDTNSLSFLDPEAFSMVPPEDRATFLDIYSRFGKWAFDFLRPTLEKYMLYPNTAKLREDICEGIERAFLAVGIDPKEKFKEMLGLRPQLNLEISVEWRTD